MKDQRLACARKFCASSINENRLDHHTLIRGWCQAVGPVLITVMLVAVLTILMHASSVSIFLDQ